MPRTNPLITREVRAQTLGSYGMETLVADVPSAKEQAQEARLLARRAYERSVGVASAGPAPDTKPVQIAAPIASPLAPSPYDPFDPNVRKIPSPTLGMATDLQNAGHPLPPNPPAPVDTPIPLREAPPPPSKSDAEIEAAAQKTLDDAIAFKRQQDAAAATTEFQRPPNPHPEGSPEAIEYEATLARMAARRSAA